MSNKKLIITIASLGILFALIGLLLAMNATGVFDLRTAMADMPLIGQRFETTDEVMIVRPLEEENYKLTQQIQNLQASLNEKEKIMAEIDNERESFLSEIANLEAEIERLEGKDVRAEQLASYYSQMDERRAVMIFDNLDDNTVLDILLKLPADKTSAFLAAMDPQRAAKLTAVLTDRTSSVVN